MKQVLAAALLLAAAAPVRAADNQIRPFFGGTFGGGTTVVDPDHGADKTHKTFGISLVSLHNIFGWDVDVANTPGFFQSGSSAGLVLSSRVTTVTGNLVVAAPRSRTEYGLRPYFIAGAGVMHVRLKDYFGSFERSDFFPGLDVGAGAVGFLTNRAGVAWELRRFKSLDRDTRETGLAIGREHVSFWRASMAFVYRY